MNKPIAGSFVLDGMLEGKLPQDVEGLKQLVNQLAVRGLRLQLAIDGGRFSLLPDSEASKSSAIENQSLESFVTEAIQSIIDLFEEDEPREIYSTIRSEEFGTGEAIQTIYSIQSNGKVGSESRVVDAATEAPLPELNAKGVAKLAGIGLVALLVAFLVSMPFVNYKQLFSDAKEKVTKLEASDVQIDTDQVENWLSAEVKSVNNAERLINIELVRGAKWDELKELKPSSKDFDDWDQFLMAKAYHTGSLDCEWYDKNGKLLQVSQINISSLVKEKSFVAPVYIATKKRISKVVLVIK